FPQFLPHTGPLLPTVIVLATIQVILDTAWCAGLVLLAGRARASLSRVAVRRRIERTLGMLLIALGVELAADTRQRDTSGGRIAPPGWLSRPFGAASGEDLRRNGGLLMGCRSGRRRGKSSTPVGERHGLKHFAAPSGEMPHAPRRTEGCEGFS